ncbi:MAG: hypothetical protein C5B49_01365 [Bdellovibrio sp.]|nr:MAG: hypothetical protein C5B49_01365 [Bdellovibrio sp.]
MLPLLVLLSLARTSEAAEAPSLAAVIAAVESPRMAPAQLPEAQKVDQKTDQKADPKVDAKAELKADSKGETKAELKGQSAEALCRIEARDSAAKAFRSCMLNPRFAEVENLRRDYERKLAAIRIQYQNELQKLKSRLKEEKTPAPAVQEKNPTAVGPNSPASAASPTAPSTTTISIPTVNNSTLSPPTKAHSILVDEDTELPEPIAIELN